MTVRIAKDGPVWTVIHARPEVRNAVNPEASRALFEAFVEFERDDNAQVAVFWGEGGAFCAGWDLKLAASMDDDDTSVSSLSFDRSTDHGHVRGPMGPSRLQLTKPVIAAVAGPAVAGGMELAIWADIRVMEETAYMGVYCRRWGVPLIDGGTVRLPRLVGEGRALDLIMTGRQVMADECLRIGLCEYVVPEGESRAAAEKLAHDIAAFPQQCMRADVASAKATYGMPLADGLAHEFANSQAMVQAEGIGGARRFADGAGRSGAFD